MRGYKFSKLSKYLSECSEEMITLTFEQIESILEFKLVKSAYKHRQYWSKSETHTFPKSWMNVGYKLYSVDLKEKICSFRKEKGDGDLLSSNEIIETYKGETKSSTQLLNVDFAINNINKYYYYISNDVNCRYKSWEHCFKNFNKRKNKRGDESVVDMLSLHLAFYLASWGMYRGSSFVLQKDYKVHEEAVLEILNEKYEPLWNIKCEEILREENLNLIIEVANNLKDIYINKRKNIDGRKNVSDILITKILMGTFGCVPAYDRFFKEGIKIYNVSKGTFNKNSIKNLAQFYQNNYEKFEIIRKGILKKGVDYPQMKLVDMCFWQIGYDKSDKKESENQNI